jgi:hypothetical protein
LPGGLEIGPPRVVVGEEFFDLGDDAALFGEGRKGNLNLVFEEVDSDTGLIDVVAAMHSEIAVLE